MAKAKKRTTKKRKSTSHKGKKRHTQARRDNANVSILEQKGPRYVDTVLGKG
jgi:hypothetical protein